MSAFSHVPVLLAETLAALSPRDGGRYMDCTLGGGGHAEAILEAAGPTGTLLGLDRDPAAQRAAGERLARFGARFTAAHVAFGELARAAEGRGPFDGILADIGVSSHQLDTAERGFSFRDEGPLDMRMDTTRGETARELIARLDEGALADVLFQLGEERRSRPIARAIKFADQDDRLHTTSDLLRAVHRVTGPKRGRIDPATRTFQALRIAVNDELGQLEALLRDGPDRLAPGGVLAIISFHSLEDRMVKRAFRGDARLVPLTKKPVVAGEAETAENPRARTAKLRAARVVAERSE